LASPTEIAPGQVWWCDGVALGFEARFKRRPVLVLEVRAGGVLLVAPLSTKRVHGQERMVTHAGGASFLTGSASEVSANVLLSPLGAWEGFAAWRAEQAQAARAAERVRSWLARLRRLFGG
jgi:hypothetical protein